MASLLHRLTAGIKLVLFIGVIFGARAGVSQVEPNPHWRIPVSITLSGGVSLGAYQAGALYYLSLVAHENPELLQLKLMTGSSAGGINALLSALSFCGTETPNPEESEFWRTWVSWSGNELHHKVASDPALSGRALLTREPLEKIASHLENVWRNGLPETCDLVVGLTVTRLKPQIITSSPLKLERQGEQISLRIQGRGPNRAPLLSNYAPQVSAAPQTLLALTPFDDSQNFKAFRDLLFAGSAFPFVFAPQKLRTCTTDLSPRWLHADYPLSCSPPIKDEIEERDFLDGGLVDNEPIAFAYDLTRAGLLTTEKGANWQAIPRSQTLSGPAEQATLFINLDLSNSTVPLASAHHNEDQVLPLLGSLFNNFLNSTRDRDALAAIARSPHFASQIASLTNTHPRMSDAILGFFGFLERDFRAFDFYLGVLEMREFTNATLVTSLRRGEVLVGNQLRTPSLALMPKKSFNRLVCIEAWLNEKPGAQALCEKLEDPAIFILSQLSLARLKAQNTDLEFITSFLAVHRFKYKDLGLNPTDANLAPELIKTQSIDTIAHLASQQPLADNLVLRATTPLLLSTVASLPNTREWSFTIGPQSNIEMSSLLVHDFPYEFRWSLGLSFENLPAWLSSGIGHPVLSPWAGLEWQPQQLKSVLLQTRFGLAFGYKFGEANFDSTCSVYRGAPVECRGLEVRPSASLTIAERLRIEAAIDIMPTVFGRVPVGFAPGFGLQFYF